VALYLAAVRYAWLPQRPSTQLALAVVVLAILATYQRNGWRHAADLSSLTERLERNAREGLPPAALAVRCSADAQCEPATLATLLTLLEDAQLGPYRDAPSRGEIASQVVPIGPAAAPRCTGHVMLPSDDWLRLPLPGGQALVGIDLRLRRHVREAALPGLAWQIAAVEANGRRRQLCDGIVEPGTGPDPLFACLRFPPLARPPGESFELALRVGGSGRSDRSLPSAQLPLFVGPEGAAPSVQAFAFFR
jgi:hypothetical protein